MTSSFQRREHGAADRNFGSSTPQSADKRDHNGTHDLYGNADSSPNARQSGGLGSSEASRGLFTSGSRHSFSDSPSEPQRGGQQTQSPRIKDDGDDLDLPFF